MGVSNEQILRRRRRAPLRRAAALALEALESRRLMCVDHFIGGAANPLAGAYDPNNPTGNDTRITVKTNGFQPAEDSLLAAAPGMPDLHSRLGAPTSIFLDFDGDAGTSTNPYSDDADATTFNAAEAAIVTAAWDEMSVYFAMFDVDVTTTQPAAGVPTAWIAIGNNISNAYSEVGPFPNTGSKAHSWAASSFARNRVSGLAHEIGHNFGLHHQSDYNNLGVKTNEYSSGWDSLHGPIMGVDFAQSVHKWFIGHSSASATTLQDDLAMIANKIKPYQPAGGDGFRADDFSNTIAAATSLTLTGTTYTGAGVIERIGDVDAFSFNVASPASVNLFATPHDVSGVDLKLGIYDSGGTLVAMKDASTNPQDLTLSLSAGTYYALLSSHGNYGDVGQYDLTVSTLPTGWESRDIGTPFQPGSSTFAGGRFTIESYGASTDNFRFAYQTLTGDGSITARVDLHTAGVATAPAGVMFREALTTNSKFVWAQVTGSGPGWSYRTTTGGGIAVPTGTTTINQPYWLRLTRSGGNVTVAKSPDGVAWTNLQTISSFSGNNTLFVGLATSAFTNIAPSRAFFTDVAFTGNVNAPPTYNALTAPTGVNVAPQATGTGLTVSWNDVADDSGYLIERSTDGVTFTSAATVATNVTTFNDNNLPGSLRYFYRVSTRDSGGGRSTPSAVVHAVNRPSAVTNLKVMSVSTTQVVVDWRDTDGETGYRVERSSDGGATWTTLSALAANVPSITSTGLTQGITYQFRITPTSDLGDGVAATINAQPRLSAVTNAAFAGIASNQVRLTWTGGVAHATGYRIDRSVDGTNFSAIGTAAGGAASTYTDSTVTPLNKYYYRVVATNTLTESASSTTIRAATPSATPLPIGWASLDVGSNVAAGAAGLAGSGSAMTATIVGGGTVTSAASGGVDKMQFLFQRASGDGDFIAKVLTHERPNTIVGAGIMIRTSLADGANHVHLRANSSGLDMIRRGGTISSTHFDATTPLWFKLTRGGALITGYYSTDGVAWTQVGTATDTIPSGVPIFIGLTTTPQDATTLVKATFDNISGSLLNQPDAAAPAAPAFTAISTDTGSSPSDRITSDNTLTLSGAAEAASLVTISRSDVGVIGTVQANYLGQFTFDYTGTTLADGAYTFTATAKDASNNLSAASSPFVVTIDTTRPAIAGWTFNVSTQRVDVQFAEALNASTVNSPDLGLANVTTNQSFAVTSALYTAATRTASYGIGVSLVDGHWRATLNQGAVADAAGNLLAGPFDYNFYYASGTASEDAFTIRVTPGGGAFEFVDGAQVHTVTRAGLEQIILDPRASRDTLHLDFSAGVDWMPPQGLRIASAMDALRVTGGPGAQTFTFAGNVMTSGAWSIDTTAVQELALASGGFTIAGDITGRALSVESNAAVGVLASTSLSTLSITGGASVNLNDNDLALRNMTVEQVAAMIAARTLGSLLVTETGIMALGSASAAQVLYIEPGQTALFSGMTVNASDVLVKYTYGGDANMDGLLDGADYGLIDNYVQFPGSSGWCNGDFNYDGVIDGADYGILDNAIQFQGEPV